MSSNMQLPRQIQSIIDEAVPSALKLYSEMKNKEKSLTSIKAHINDNTLPRSIQFKLDLVIPKCVLDNNTVSEQAENCRRMFQESLQTFQREAIVQMRTVAEFAVESQKRALLQFIDQTDNEIITFYHRLLAKINETSAETFMTDMQTYPNIPEENRSADVKEVLEFIAAWRTTYTAGLRTKLARDVENEIKQERKLISKEAAEDVIMGDNNNELVVELIRREMKPIKDTLQRLNKTAVERPTSTGKKQKDSQPNSKISWQHPVSRQEDAKEEKRSSGKQHGRRDNQPFDEHRRGREKTRRNQVPERGPQSILKRSTSGQRQERTRSESSHSNRSRN